MSAPRTSETSLGPLACRRDSHSFVRVSSINVRAFQGVNRASGNAVTRGEKPQSAIIRALRLTAQAFVFTCENKVTVFGDRELWAACGTPTSCKAHNRA